MSNYVNIMEVKRSVQECFFLSDEEASSVLELTIDLDLVNNVENIRANEILHIFSIAHMLNRNKTSWMARI